MKRLLLSIGTTLLAATSMQAQVSNPGFEDTTTGPVFDAASAVNRGGWLMHPLAYDVNSQARTGSHAATIWTWYYYGIGFLINGASSIVGGLNNAIDGGIPSTIKPAQLTGHYKFDLGQNVDGLADSAVVIVVAKKWNSQQNRRDTVAFGRLALPSTSVYKPFSLNIADLMPGISPDSVSISFWSCNKDVSNCNCVPTGEGACHYLTIDDLNLNANGTSIYSFKAQNNISVYPNPVSENLTVDLTGVYGSVAIHLFDCLGRGMISSNQLGGKKISIPCKNITAGVYRLNVVQNGRVLHQQSVIFK